MLMTQSIFDRYYCINSAKNERNNGELKIICILQPHHDFIRVKAPSNEHKNHVGNKLQL